MPQAVHVDVVAGLEIGLGGAGHDRSQMKDHIGLGAGQQIREVGVGDVADQHLVAGFVGRLDLVRQDELVDTAPPDALGAQRRRQSGTEHPGRAGHENTHCDIVRRLDPSLRRFARRRCHTREEPATKDTPYDRPRPLHRR